MKIISFNDIKSLDIPAEKCYAWVSDMILNKKNAILPQKIQMNLPGNIFCNVMPSICNMLKIGGKSSNTISFKESIFRQ